ncbi:MAG: hypothetical protein NW216_08575 [Hyphomicrobium sp.]|nr:hypothetical protein [Hyphomicrobium sp.]
MAGTFPASAGVPFDLPAGWTASAPPLSGLLLAQSPDGGDAQPVTVLIPPCQDLKGPLRDAFVEDVPLLIETLYGDLMRTPATVPLAGLAASPVAVSARVGIMLDDGIPAEVEAVGYRVGNRYQIILLAAPGTLSDEDENVVEGRTLVEDLRARQFVLTEDAVTAIAGQEQSGRPAPDDTQPLTDESVENVIQYLRMVFSAGDPSAAPEPQTITALLLNDGRAFEAVREPAAAFKPETRPLGSPGVARWRRDGEGYLLTFPDGTQGTAVAKAALTSAAAAGQRIDGTYTTDVVPVAPLSRTLHFNADGSLRIGEATTGRYTLDARTLTLTPSGGDAVAYLFGWQGEEPKHPSRLIIGTNVYERAE